MQAPSTAFSTTRIVLAFACIYVIWGTTYLAIALSIRTLPPFTSGSARFLIAAALMFAWLRWRDRHAFAAIDFKRAALCGILLTGFGNGLVVWAQQGVPSGIAALLVAAIPIFILAIEYFFFAGRLPEARAALGMTLAVIGVVVIVTRTRNLSGTAEPTGEPIYVAAILLAVLSWSFGTLLQRQAGVKPSDILAFTCAQIFFGALVQLALATLNGEWRTLDVSHVSATSLFGVAYLVVFGSIVALSCYSWLLTQVAPQKVATYALVNPVVALALGAVVLDEKITVTAVFAAASVLVGIGLVLFPTRSSPVWKTASSGETA